MAWLTLTDPADGTAVDVPILTGTWRKAHRQTRSIRKRFSGEYGSVTHGSRTSAALYTGRTPANLSTATADSIEALIDQPGWLDCSGDAFDGRIVRCEVNGTRRAGDQLGRWAWELELAEVLSPSGATLLLTLYQDANGQWYATDDDSVTAEGYMETDANGQLQVDDALSSGLALRYSNGTVTVEV